MPVAAVALFGNRGHSCPSPASVIAAAQGFASPLNHFTAYWLVVDLLAQSMCFGEKAYELDLLLDHR
jgi:hypothetical protein